jgi:hypothetical protein
MIWRQPSTTAPESNSSHKRASRSTVCDIVQALRVLDTLQWERAT